VQNSQAQAVQGDGDEWGRIVNPLELTGLGQQFEQTDLTDGTATAGTYRDKSLVN